MLPVDLRALDLRPSDRRPEIPGGGPQTVAEILDRPLAAHPDREALVGRGARFSFVELDAEVSRTANALAALGAEVGTRVACCLPNSAELVVAFLASQRLGAVWVGVNAALAPPEKAMLLADSGAEVFVASQDAIAGLSAHAAELPELRDTFVCSPGEASDPWRDWCAASLAQRLDTSAIDPFAPAAIAYTSGTTGQPKGAVHSQHNLLLPGAVARAAGRYPEGTRHAAVLPLTILNIVVLAPCVAFQLGAPCIAVDRIDPVGLAGWVREERVGHFAAVPTVLYDLLTHPDVTREDLESLQAPEIGGADCPPAFLDLYRERFGKGVEIGYGMTEAPTSVTRTDPDEPARAGLCGRAQPQVEIHILGDDGAELPTGETGEVCVAPAEAGPFAGVFTPMLGYWNRAEETEAALAGDILHTGDLGELDDDGNLFLRGRRNELILRGGANVYPAEVERALQADPAVAASAVLGVPDARLGERVVAAVQLVPGVGLDVPGLRARCGERVARYKVPDEIVAVSGLPRNAMNKVVKAALLPLFDQEERES
ncbi:MAG: AMP-binding protein [Deltaproteobacteria bacterium]|nr:AMP-binding protein [Deltaproteobacteria bacterium]MBW2445299.1 AMP-binding protein [Deltaproteobacteria bacterium]